VNLLQQFLALLGVAAVQTLPPVSSMAEPLSKLSGPVRVVKAGSDVAYHQGILSLLWFTGHLSLNLGVVNAFPLPVLDGGRLLFILMEAITGRKVDRRVEETATTLTTLLLLWLFFSTSWNDLRFLFAR
jgi:regulator of sigma E protease